MLIAILLTIVVLLPLVVTILHTNALIFALSLAVFSSIAFRVWLRVRMAKESWGNGLAGVGLLITGLLCTFYIIAALIEILDTTS